MFFAKKITIFKKKDRETWQKIRDILKNAGLKIRAGSYSADTLCACGCGSKLDPRNFGAKGRIDRDIYFIDVKADDEQLAKNILSESVDEKIETFIDADPIGKNGRL